ncbi:hypothetical protein ILYODFUR_034243 [Ilyodon furcidens]|uniref:Uncharacterized protein n=1 Tax=Ilyodon furcidens TaxID=33524 RepID=A0ABV0TP59_9TELE
MLSVFSKFFLPSLSSVASSYVPRSCTSVVDLHASACLCTFVYFFNRIQTNGLCLRYVYIWVLQQLCNLLKPSLNAKDPFLEIQINMKIASLVLPAKILDFFGELRNNDKVRGAEIADLQAES